MDSNKLPMGNLPINDLAGIPLELSERMIIEETLRRNEGNRTKTAEVLGICIRTLRSKLKKYRDSDTLNEKIAA